MSSNWRFALTRITKTAVSLAAALLAGHALADVVTIPDSALTHSDGHLYTNDFGSVVVTTGGGSGANIGQADGRNDDGYSGPIALGYTLQNFFGSDYSSIYVNNNGNITFQGGLSDYTPEGLQGATVPVIAPFFADVDTRGANSGVVYINQSITGETIITWDHVGYYNSLDDKLDTFQLVLRSSDFATPDGEGTIGFFYGSMNWDTGHASNVPAAVGFGDGQSNGYALQGSTQSGVYNIVNDSYIWFNVADSGTPTPVPPSNVPEPGSLGLLLAGLGLVGAALRRRQA